jgi:hypothetical protein
MTELKTDDSGEPQQMVRVVLPDVSECFFPEWKRTLFVSPTTGAILAAAGLFGMDSAECLHKSLEKQVQSIMHEKRLYFPTTWVAEVKPIFKRICAQLETKAREMLKTELER